MEVERRNEGGREGEEEEGRRRGVCWSQLMGRGSAVWSKHSSQRISTIGRMERKNETEGEQQNKSEGGFFLIFTWSTHSTPTAIIIIIINFNLSGGVLTTWGRRHQWKNERRMKHEEKLHENPKEKRIAALKRKWIVGVLLLVIQTNLPIVKEKTVLNQVPWA